MASNKTLDSLYNYNGIKTVWSQRSQSISGNTSVLRATITQYSTAWSYSNDTSTLTLKADGQTKTVTVPSWNWSGANSRSLGYVEFTIDHNTNGSKSASISHSWNQFPQSKSGTFSFDTIPRTSTFTIPSSFTMGSAFTVSISRASSSFTHWVELWDGSTRLYSSGNTIGTSDSVNVALSTLAARSPNAMSRSFTVKVNTYNGSTKIGSTSKTITGSVPSTVKPTFSAVTVSENVSSVATLVGAYVQTKSKLKLTITGASGKYGSTIRSYKITGAGYNSNSSSTTTGVLSVSGNQTIKGIVTDSRGQTYEKSIVVNILPYTPPTLSNLSFKRTLPDKTEAPLGDNATVGANVKVHSLIVNGVQKNSIKYHVQSARVGYSFADKANTTSTSLTKSYSDVWSGYLVDYSYNFRVRAGDVFGFSGWSVGVVPTGIVTQQWGSKTTSFGKMIDNTSYNVQVGSGGLHSEGPVYSNNLQVINKGSIGELGTSDLNNITTGGHYRLPQSSDMSNEPSSNASYGQLEVIRGSGDTVAQAVYCYTTGDVYTRTASFNDTSYNWTSWKKQATTSDLSSYAKTSDLPDEYTSDEWRVTKMKNGMTQVAKRFWYGSIPITSTWGNVYTSGSNRVGGGSYPVTFTNPPIVTSEWQPSSGHCWMMRVTGNTAYTTTVPDYQLIRATSNTNSGTLHVIAVGWT